MESRYDRARARGAGLAAVDFNPRGQCCGRGFQDRRLKPLGHPSLRQLRLHYLLLPAATVLTFSLGCSCSILFHGVREGSSNSQPKGCWFKSSPRYHAMHHRLRDAVGNLNLQAFRSQFYPVYPGSDEALALSWLPVGQHFLELTSIRQSSINVDLGRLAALSCFLGKLLTLSEPAALRALN